MSIAYPAQVALFFCKVILAPVDDNGAFTQWRDSEWDTSGGVYHCRREVVELYDPSVDQGATPQAFNQEACRRTIMTLGPQYDATHRDAPWRFYAGACPVATINEQTGEVLAYTLPPCPESARGVMECESDSAI